MMDTRQIVDYADADQAKEMRDAFYSALQDKIMSHIEDQKLRVAQNLFTQMQPEQSATTEYEAAAQAQ
jgi:hypothetical protein